MSVKAVVIREDGQKMTFGDNDWHIPSDGLENWSSLPLSVSSTEIPSYDGGIITSSRVTMQDRTITAICNSKNRDTLRAKAISFFAPGKDYEVHLTYRGRTRWCSGRLYAFKANEGNIYRPTEIAFTILCPNPYLLSESDFGKNIADVQSFFGFPFMSFLPVEDGSVEGFNTGFLVSQYTYATDVEIVNDGDVKSGIKATIKIDDTVVNPRINVGNGYFRLLTTLKATDVLEIDATCHPPIVLLNGENAMHLADRNSSILNMMVEPGTSSIGYDADDGSENMNVYIYFNKQYIGI